MGLYGLSKKAAFGSLPSFGHIITCHAISPEGFVVCLLCPPVQLLSLHSGKVERMLIFYLLQEYNSCLDSLVTFETIDAILNPQAKLRLRP